MTDLNLIPTESLLAELKRRMLSFIDHARELLTLAEPPPPEEEGPGDPWPGPLDREAEITAADLQARTGPTDVPPPPGWTSSYTRAQAAGLGVPNRGPNRELPAHVKKVRELPKLMDPGRKADMWAAVDRDLQAGLTEALAAAEASGDTEAADYLRELPGLRAQSGMAAPSLAQIVAINKRNAADAFVQPILPPTLKGAVQAPTLTEIEWFDNPAVVTLPLLDLVANPAPLRPGVPATPAYELEARTKGLAKLIKTTLPKMLSDGYTGHLPRPVARVLDGGGVPPVLQLLLEPVVLWRLLVHLEPQLPYVHYASNLRALLNTLIEANVKPEEQGRVAGDAERFRADLSAWLVQRHQTETRPRIAQALKRQIRILNVDLQEKGIPAMPKLHDLGAKMPFEHPRELFKDAEPTLGAQLGKGSAQLHMPAAEPAEPGDGYRAERGEQNG